MALFALGIKNPQLLTTLNVMGDFFLLFDVTMDISHGKFISGQSGHTHHANFPFSTVKVSRVTAPIVKLSMKNLQNNEACTNTVLLIQTSAL